MSPVKRRRCQLDAESIAYYRRNPCIAAEDLLGVKLLDSQKYILQNIWNAQFSALACCRDFGKSFLGAVFFFLKAVLYENQCIYIISNVGAQAAETFMKMEQMVLRTGKTAASIKSLKDIAEKETKKSPTNRDGFSHAPSGYHVAFYNGSEIFTLNGKPDNIRGKRASLVFFDEAAFCSDELIVVGEAFAMQNMEFVTSTDESYNPELDPKQVPTQIVYASSQDGMDTTFYRHYKEFAMKMFAGDRNYFVCDMICDTAIETYMNGEPYIPLLTREKVDTALKANKDKALREYYNIPTRDMSKNQIVRWATIRRNEKFYLPQLGYDPARKIVLAFDPARTNDNSIVGAMSIYNDPDFGWCGDIVNCVNFVDVASKKKYKLDSNRQIDGIRNMLVSYNGENPDYEYVDSLFIDAGSGGGGTSTYADGLLNDWEDISGRVHRGLIDDSSEIYAGYSDMYSDAVDKLRLIQPKKYKTQMVEEFIELMNLGVIRFPYEYNGNDYVTIMGDDGETQTVILTEEQQLALAQIDLMKHEITSIQKYENADHTSRSYALSKEKENTMHDDRFYVAILLAHRLYELRRADAVFRVSEEDDLENAEICVTRI